MWPEWAHILLVIYKIRGLYFLPTSVRVYTGDKFANAIEGEIICSKVLFKSTSNQTALLNVNINIFFAL